ncbi:MAG: DUF1573 domain-containing protein [Bacteroidota bacterium]|nr:DUF1573 domain-containing protein [Bacteroidota bacterium]
MKNFTLLFIALLSFASISHAQEGPVILWENTHHNFGTIKEEGGAVTYIFKFKNTGKQPVKLLKVQPGCGCTVSEWTKTDIVPGQTGFVSATYDPTGRPGPFHKSVSVTANTSPEMHFLTFSGDVEERAKTLVDSFPFSSGNLRYVMQHIQFGQVFNNQKDTVGYITAYNTSDVPMSIVGFNNNDIPYLSMTGLPMIIPPKQEVKIPIHFNPSAANDFGMLWNNVILVTDDPFAKDKSVSVVAEVLQYFPPLTEAEKAKAPRVNMPEFEHDFGTITQGEVVSYDFQIFNRGRQDLKILKVKASCGCTATEPAKTLLKPNEASEIKVTYHSDGKKGLEEKHVTVYTNDPANPVITLKIKANVLVPEKTGTTD